MSAIRILGAEGSPYSRKMRALLRYRRIPHRWVVRNSRDDRDTPAPRVDLIPILLFPGKNVAHVDSTPLIRELERRHAERSVLPPDPALAFLDALLEDYADEWVTKMMFHYRWAFPPDVGKAKRILPLWADVTADEDRYRKMSDFIAERQVGRLAVVGSNETTAPVIEASYERLLHLLDAHLRTHPFLLGRRPGASDFALFGQLSQLVLFDPTPAAIALEISPRVYTWCELVEDLSGIEVSDDDWIRRGELPQTVRALLAEVGRVYAPFLLANAAALERGASEVRCSIDSREWVQQAFPYQGKCLRWLREGYAALSGDDRAVVDRALAGTGCEPLFVA